MRPSQEQSSASMPTSRYELVRRTRRASTSSLPRRRPMSPHSQHSGWTHATASSRSNQPAATPTTVAAASRERSSSTPFAAPSSSARPARSSGTSAPTPLRERSTNRVGSPRSAKTPASSRPSCKPISGSSDPSVPLRPADDPNIGPEVRAVVFGLGEHVSDDVREVVDRDDPHPARTPLLPEREVVHRYLVPGFHVG